ncbi:helix-turn-helix domain-containing protein [Runella salmonicolor]|nr:helix-turn-helix transcriptional regulator [Runella salmonicolor]
MDNFGERLKKLREDNKMTQQDLANVMGKANKTVISSWELNKNQPSMSEIEKLCDYFNVSTDYLIRGKCHSVSKPNSEYVTISKDELIDLQNIAIGKLKEEVQKQKASVENLKNSPVDTDKL